MTISMRYALLFLLAASLPAQQSIGGSIQQAGNGGGSITGVTAGTGLSGGGSSGNVTLRTNGYAVQSSCIAVNGDSLTFGGQDGAGDNYPGDLGLLLSRQVLNYGYSGQTSTQIAARFLNSPQIWTCYNIFWVGRNNLVQATILADLASMVAKTSGGRYLVLGVINDQNEPSGSTNYNTILAINAAIAAAYPTNYVDIRSLLVAQANPSIGADVETQIQDIPPYSFRAVTGTGTITAAITNTTSCPALSGSALNTGNVVKIDSEYIVNLTWSGGTVLTCTRGYGSTATTHLINAAYTLTDYLHQGASGYTYVAGQAATFIGTNDLLAGSTSSPWPEDLLNNLMIGNSALNNNTTGLENTALGNWSLFSAITASGNVAVGYGSLMNDTASNNTAIGTLALASDTTGTTNTAVAYGALYANLTGNDNVAIGHNALTSLLSGNNNVGLGFQALNKATSNDNTCVGFECLLRLTTGNDNNSVGSGSLENTSTGGTNNGMGYDVLASNTTGGGNVALGHAAGYGVGTNASVSGSNNTFIGANTSLGSAAQQSFYVALGSGAGGSCSTCVILGRISQETVYSGTTDSTALNSPVISAISIPVATTPTIANIGAAGSGTYSYVLVSRTNNGSNGYKAAGSSTGTTPTGNATLNSTNYNTVSLPVTQAGVACYDIYRTANPNGSGSPYTGLVQGCAYLSNTWPGFYSDQGASGDGTSPPVSATGGGIFQEVLTTPASSSAACIAGQFADDAGFHYVCTATNTWKRVALSSF